LWVILSLLDPDSDSKYGSTELIESGSRSETLLRGVCVCVLPSMLSMSTPSVVVGVRAGSADPLLFCHCHMAGPAAPPPGRGYPLLGDLNIGL
jgi:hypothetical protein